MHIQNIDLGGLSPDHYHTLICALGYESRATAVARTLCGKFTRGVALGFDHGKELSYQANATWFSEHSFSIINDLGAVTFGEKFRSLLIQLQQSARALGQITVAIDVSCFDRLRLAEIIHTIRTQEISRVSFDFWYCIASFQRPSPVVGRNAFAGPVHRRLAGRFIEPGRPLALVAGLGYELGKIMGAAEYLQATRVIAFIPESPIDAYEKEVLQANATVLDEIEQRNILRYPVGNPERTIAMLDSTIRGLKRDYNVVLLPNGPKIFAVCSFIAHALHPTVGVWRISSGPSLHVREAYPSEEYIGFQWSP